jgi:DNA-binding transcriptional LysR family regulator
MNPMMLPNTVMNTAHGLEEGSRDRLAGIDLNLLVAFDVLARERSVTRTAARLGVTQSAVSHALRRLRELLGDPLLVRSGNGMALTPHAESLVVPVRSGLITLGRALSRPAEFEPLLARRGFALASIDVFDALVVPSLLARVRREAPGIDVSVLAAGDRRLSEQLETGEVDAAVLPNTQGPRSAAAEAAGQGLVRKTMFRDHFVCFLRGDHPALAVRARRGRGATAKSLSLETYVSLSHMLISTSGAGPGIVDELLAELGRTRRIALRIPHYSSALAIVAQSDLVLTGPAALVSLARADLNVVALPVPIQLPQPSINLVWHERFGNDPGHRWLRELTAEVARGVQAQMVRARPRGEVTTAPSARHR